MLNNENRESDQVTFAEFLQMVKESAGNIIENECKRIIDAWPDHEVPKADEVLKNAFENVHKETLEATLLNKSPSHSDITNSNQVPSGTTTTITVKGHNDIANHIID